MSLLVPKAAPVFKGGLLPRDIAIPSCVSSCASSAVTASELCSLGAADTTFGVCVDDACASEDITAFISVVTASCTNGVWASSGWSSATVPAITATPAAFQNSTLAVLPSAPARSMTGVNATTATTATSVLASSTSRHSHSASASSSAPASSTSKQPTDVVSSTASSASSTPKSGAASTRSWPAVRRVALGLAVVAVGTFLLC